MAGLGYSIFQKNMPYDQFVTEQIAGDLLPNARGIKFSPPALTAYIPKG